MFDWYDQIKMYYDLGIYGADQVQVFVDAGWIRDVYKRQFQISTTKACRTATA